MDHQDGFWVNRALRGDHAAFGRLYTRYQPHLARFVAHRLPAEEVDDLVQEAFLQAFDGLAGLRQPKRFGAWLMGIALNLIHNRYRRMQRRPETASDHWELDVHFQGKNGSHASESAEDHTLDRLLHQALEGAVRELSPGNREALLLHYAQGLRYSEIAALLEVPLSTVRSRLHKARAQLRAELEPLIAPSSPTRDPGGITMIEATIFEVFLVEKEGANEPHSVVVLKAHERQRFLCMWIGPFEATSILMHLRGVESKRPLTYDLMAELLKEGGVGISKVVVSELDGEVFKAQVMVGANGTVRPVDARPSDALALALRSDAPIWIDEAVLEKAGQDQPQPHKDEQGFVSIKPMELPEWTNALRHLKIPHD